jgi:DNA replication protein DnaC
MKGVELYARVRFVVQIEGVSQRYERGSIIVTSNLPFDEWTGVFGSPNTT